MQELSRLIELFENPSKDLGKGPHFAESSRFKIPHIPAPPDSSPWQDALGRIVEAEIIPRLLLSNKGQQKAAPPIATDQHLDEFLKLLLDADIREILSYVRQLETRGMPLETIFLDILGGASRALGRMWESDHCDFIDVIDGLHRLHNILQALTPIADIEPLDCRRAMFSMAPGETHDFGVVIVEKFFRMAGWETRGCCDNTYAAELRDNYYEIAGFSLSCHRYLDRLKAAVKTARQVSKNPSIKILVGGALFVQNPELIHAVEADGIAINAPDAVQMAEGLLSDCAYV